VQMQQGGGLQNDGGTEDASNNTSQATVFKPICQFAMGRFPERQL